MQLRFFILLGFFLGNFFSTVLAAAEDELRFAVERIEGKRFEVFVSGEDRVYVPTLGAPLNIAVKDGVCVKDPTSLNGREVIIKERALKKEHEPFREAILAQLKSCRKGGADAPILPPEKDGPPVDCVPDDSIEAQEKGDSPKNKNSEGTPRSKREGTLASGAISKPMRCTTKIFDTDKKKKP